MHAGELEFVAIAATPYTIVRFGRLVWAVNECLARWSTFLDEENK